jgi:hypothetical protein
MWDRGAGKGHLNVGLNVGHLNEGHLNVGLNVGHLNVAS